MTVRPYTPEDYPTILAWWLNHRVTPTPQDCLPALGTIVEDSGRPILAAWASMDSSSGVAYLLFPVGNPSALPTRIAPALTHAVGYLSAVLRDMGYHTLMSATHRASLAGALTKLGFTRAQPVHYQTISLV